MTVHFNLPHIVLQHPEERPYTSVPQMGASKRIPQRDRASHAAFLQMQLTRAWKEAESEFVASHAERNGVYLQFRGTPGFELLTQSLEDLKSKKIRLCNVRTENENTINSETGIEEHNEVIYATVFVSNDKRNHFLKKVNQYASEYAKKEFKKEKFFPKYERFAGILASICVDLNEQKIQLKPEISNDEIIALSQKGLPNELVTLLLKTPKNADLINGIQDVTKAIATSFWVDAAELFPSGTTREWCEVWLRDEAENIEQKFIEIVYTLKLPVKEGRLRFPERIVKLIYLNEQELELLIKKCDWIAEFRKAKETADFWVNQPPRDQAQWGNDFLSRLKVDRESLISVCILDTGINSEHRLLKPFLDSSDCHSYHPDWGVHDHHGHGTKMAGLAAFGNNFQQYLESTGTIRVGHILESVKILPPGSEKNPTELWGHITAQGIYRAELQAPARKRVVCMAVASEDTRDEGRPSSWSAAVDQTTSGVDNIAKRLMLISAGNFTTSLTQAAAYPKTQLDDSIHDPAQSWNALTVGAYTQLTQLSDPTLRGYHPIAGVNQLSPFSTTSYKWEENKWPIKPDVVFEGGNLAVDGSGFVTECDDLSLLTTYYKPTERLFDSFNMTSAATAQAAHFAAKIMTQYPDYWPETVRALIVHSAEWPQELKRQFAADDKKSQIANVIKCCGYGVPDLDRAIYCASNSLTMVSQAEIQPYEKRDGRVRTKDMHFYELPWPVETLRDLGEVMVEMKITLSYFIEPGPGEVGWKDRYRYPSHLLRFDINSPGESKDEFLPRINAAVRDEENGHPGTESASAYWVIGSQNRDKGSIHSDIWRGTAADLALTNMIAVSPRIGWWRERTHLGKCCSQTRYSLIVSIRTPGQDVDIYTPVAQKIATLTPVEIKT